MLIPRAAILLAGIAAGAITTLWRAREARGTTDLRSAIEALEARIAAQEARNAAQEALSVSRFGELDTRVAAHESKLKEVPSTGQIVTAMEELLSKTMSSLDQRLSAQAHSIEVLKTTVSQTDELLERVLEALDSLREYSPESSQPQGNPVSAHGLGAE